MSSFLTNIWLIYIKKLVKMLDKLKNITWYLK